jgi:hypothetical protein
VRAGSRGCQGTVTLEGTGTLTTGDAVRFTATGGQKVAATEPAEILVWEMHATVTGVTPAMCPERSKGPPRPGESPPRHTCGETIGA